MRLNNIMESFAEYYMAEEGFKSLLASGMLAASSLVSPTNAQAVEPVGASQHHYHDVSESFLKALHQVESSGKLQAPPGDNGKAIGPFQIHKQYWQDALQYEPSIGGKYEDCNNLDYAKKIVCAYLNRYGKQYVVSNNYEALAKIHNGGPKGTNNPNTNKYWDRVKHALHYSK